MIATLTLVIHVANRLVINVKKLTHLYVLYANILQFKESCLIVNVLNITFKIIRMINIVNNV